MLSATAWYIRRGQQTRANIGHQLIKEILGGHQRHILQLRSAPNDSSQLPQVFVCLPCAELHTSRVCTRKIKQT